LFTDLGGKFKLTAQDSDLEYLFWQCKNPPVSSDLKPPLVIGGVNHESDLKDRISLKLNFVCGF
jgi:hypothetical protein